MKRRWKVDEGFMVLVALIWGIGGLVTFVVVRTGEGTRGHRPPMSALATVSLVLWLLPFAIVVLGCLAVTFWSMRPRRVWESAEDARIAHANERKRQRR